MEACIEIIAGQQEAQDMGTHVRIRIPQLLQERGLDYLDLHYGARITRNTAKKLADPEECEKMSSIYFRVLENVCKFLEVGVEEILVLEDETVEG